MKNGGRFTICCPGRFSSANTKRNFNLSPKPPSFGLFRANCKLLRVEKALIDRVVAELNSSLDGTTLRSITQIGKQSYVVTFEGEVFRRLLISIEARDPRIYLIRRRDKELKKLTAHRSLFAIAAERMLAGLEFTSANVSSTDRIVRLVFGEKTLVIQLTGSSSNLFVLDENGRISVVDRTSTLPGQAVDNDYRPPVEHVSSNTPEARIVLPTNSGSVSEDLDAYFSSLDADADFQRVADVALAKSRQKIKKTEKLVTNLEKDLVEHGDAETWKRFGDLLLASQNTAKRLNGEIEVVDIFDESAPTIKIDADDNDSLTDTAQKYFRRYAKARNALNEVRSRIERATSEIGRLKKIEQEIIAAVERKDLEYLSTVGTTKTRVVAPQTKRKEEKQLPGIRTYISSDGFEIFVGKKSTDNDFLTQRVAHSRDTWMHAADYPGSHVVIRNANRKTIPQRTLIEAAQLAAFFSQGNKQTKAAVNYTEKKFVSKPKGAAPGLVRLASFKTLLVEPVFPPIEKRDQ